MKNQKYIVRSIKAGVFYGEIKERDHDEVTMTNARCLHYMSGYGALNQAAEEGFSKPGNCRFTMAVPELIILDVCEILPCSDKACACIDGIKEWKA